MDKMRRVMDDAIKDTRWDYQSLSLAIGKNRTYIHQYLKKQNPAFLPAEIAVAVCERLHLDWKDYVEPSVVKTLAGTVTVQQCPKGSVIVKAVEASASAGAGSIGQTDDIEAYWCVPTDIVAGLDREKIRIITLRGDSMEPVLNHGDRIMVDTSNKTPSPPGIFVIWDGMGLVAKRVEYLPTEQCLRVSSANPAYEAYKLPLDQVDIQGRVVWFARSL